MSEAYVKEVNHRVKNNLAMIDSVLSLEINALTASDSATILLLNDIRERVKSVALVHQMLYDLSRKGKIEMFSYLRNLADTITESHTVINDAPVLDFDL